MWLNNKRVLPVARLNFVTSISEAYNFPGIDRRRVARQDVLGGVLAPRGPPFLIPKKVCANPTQKSKFRLVWVRKASEKGVSGDPNLEDFD